MGGGRGGPRRSVLSAQRRHNGSPSRRRVPRHKHRAFKKVLVARFRGAGLAGRRKGWNEQPIFRSQSLHNRALEASSWVKWKAARGRGLPPPSTLCPSLLLQPALGGGGRAWGGGWQRRAASWWQGLLLLARLAPLKGQPRA